MNRPRSRKFIAAMVATVVVAAVVPAVVVASIITNATGVAVKVTAKLASNTNTVFTGTSGPLNGLVTTCTASQSTFQLTTKGGGLGPFTISNPTFTGCTDNLGGTDTITSNSTNGPWTSTYINSAGSPAPDQLQLGLPQAGQTLVSTFAPNCTLTVSPGGPSSVSGAYDNAGNLSISNAPLTYDAEPTVAGGCPTGTGPGTATFSTALKPSATGKAVYKVSPAIFGVH